MILDWSQQYPYFCENPRFLFLSLSFTLTQFKVKVVPNFCGFFKVDGERDKVKGTPPMSTLLSFFLQSFIADNWVKCGMFAAPL